AALAARRYREARAGWRDPPARVRAAYLPLGLVPSRLREAAGRPPSPLAVPWSLWRTARFGPPRLTSGS
ncbi:MAG: hypothetical protein KGQ28_06185, partial [Hyphomicrobiales bacterium]|nr:hypothetical protein [Hyphomicrobiales bacterium]